MRQMFVVGLLLAAGCSSGGEEPPDGITRIDGPAVVDEDQGGADDDVTDGSSDG